MVSRRTAVLTQMRVEQKHANTLRNILEKSAKAIDADIRKLPEGSITRAQAEAQRASIGAYLDQDFSNIERVIEQGQKDAAKAASNVVSMYEATLLDAVMDPADVKALAVSEANRASRGVEAALQRMGGASANPLSKNVYRTLQLSKGWVDNTINQALVSGWDAKKLAAAVRGSIDPRVRGGVSYAAERLARTEINNAFHASAAKRYQDSGIVDLVDWNLSSSHPEGDICDSLVSEGPYQVRNVPRKPHPQCYCYITPHLPEPDEFMANLLAGKYGDEPWVDKVDNGKVADIVAKKAYRNSTQWLDDKEFLQHALRPGGVIDGMVGDDGSDVLLRDIWEKQGYRAKPTIVQNLPRDERAIYRGVRQSGGSPPAADIIAQFKTGDEPFAGAGIFGNGSYFSNQFDRAVGYAGGDPGAVMAARWRDDANLMYFDSFMDMAKWQEEAFGKAVKEGSERVAAGTMKQEELDLLRAAYMDPGRAASMQGVDGYRVKGPDADEYYWVVQNRSMLEVEG